ncbi:hypothetical protein BRADI_3g30690v3 [Brachypodium distachyon]|uniref:Uncharacterized protein n=1 Tax=Brachypodium distachyon TaxID=15368 RepID=A0A0Q3FCL5_BRADI|nr:hypothetical protein BRADI_3g30690v3 [Brachypodium distachyon]
MHLASRSAGKTEVAAHARSASLPHEHTHPVLAHLDDSIRALRSWSAITAGKSSSGIALVDAILTALGELLVLPQAVAAFGDKAACDPILDRFLMLADAYGTFLSALVTLKQSVAELQVGTRCGDGPMISASLRAHMRTEKELCRLISTMRHATRCTLVVAAVTVEASEAIFLQCAAMSPDMPAIVQKVSSSKWLARLGVRPAAEKVASETATVPLERLEKLEECIDGLEIGSEKVFRKLLQSRVSLLNILTLQS